MPAQSSKEKGWSNCKAAVCCDWTSSPALDLLMPAPSSTAAIHMADTLPTQLDKQ